MLLPLFIHAWRTVGQNDVFLRSAIRRFGHVGQDGHVEMFAEALIQQV